MDFVEYPDREMMMMKIADQIGSELATMLRQQDRVSLAVPGGTTPGPIFDDLSAAEMEWDRVDVLLTDERWVPESSERSNTRLLKERLLTGKAASARLIPLYADAPRPEDKLAGLSATVESILPLSVVLLGMGADMHTASLFPGADLLAEGLSPKAPALLPMRAPTAPEPRITLSARVLNSALSKHIVITGAEKRAALEEARRLKDPMQAPVYAILSDATVHWAE
ncbi:6-phosphogluconolactonase [Pseudoruegeria aquimaris]|uniref:6-phosphogluconolactonase n=1 Tax=Pseudoruegeria aquimaris TaxID=393663 RepID=A0A1Y5R7A5_9RHOB|nr:6-phosphogluconolactonase [Pseudoruegeria aquimaris]SLN10790.1 6-phosphogluconolactonase [Pseudoruegeria aquimaris]